jgi:hypothetical protein
MALDFDTFKANLKSGKYESLAGARRAVGKAGEFSIEQREAARKLVDKHFDAAPQGTKVAAPKKAAKVAAKAPKAEKKAAAPKAPKKEAKAAPAKREPKVTAKATPAKREPKVREIKGTLLKTGLDSVNLEDLSSIATQLRIAEVTCSHATGAIAALKTAGAEPADGDMQDARTTLGGAISIFRQLVNQVNKAEPAAAATKTRKPKTSASESTEQPSNGVSTAGVSKAESLFAGSRPEASTES